jgi:hypothetical protein
MLPGPSSQLPEVPMGPRGQEPLAPESMEIDPSDPPWAGLDHTTTSLLDQ